VIYVGIDDTDMPGTPGTNQFAKALAVRLADRYGCSLIVRHQLLFDSRVPYTSKNSSASMLLKPKTGEGVEPLIDELRAFVREWFIEGSDPGFCVALTIPGEITEFGERCQKELMTQREARQLAKTHNIHLEGCGGTEDGVIGCLAAVGLVAEGNDGRVVQIGSWPDDLDGPQDIASLEARGVKVRSLESGENVATGTVDVGKHLRPNYRGKEIILHVEPKTCACQDSASWLAVRLT
jgi:hypothetical protein